MQILNDMASSAYERYASDNSLFCEKDAERGTRRETVVRAGQPLQTLKCETLSNSYDGEYSF